MLKQCILNNFHKKIVDNFRKLSQDFQQFSVFRPNAQSITAEFVKFFWKIWENNAF